MHRAVSFYRHLGIEFTLHSHGTGPEHYASLTSDFVLEIYPATSSKARTENLRLGFLVPELDAKVESLRGFLVTVVSEPKESEWGRRAVLLDFDGNTIELLEVATTQST